VVGGFLRRKEWVVVVVVIILRRERERKSSDVFAKSKNRGLSFGQFPG
jgi:hypothetical protein